jgi:hypothetical protein
MRTRWRIGLAWVATLLVLELSVVGCSGTLRGSRLQIGQEGTTRTDADQTAIEEAVCKGDVASAEVYLARKGASPAEQFERLMDAARAARKANAKAEAAKTKLPCCTAAGCPASDAKPEPFDGGAR